MSKAAFIFLDIAHRALGDVMQDIDHTQKFVALARNFTPPSAAILAPAAYVEPI